MQAPRVRIAALGDLMVIGQWARLFRERDSDPFHELSPLLDRHDLVFANLETTSFSPAGRIAKQPRVIASSSVIQRCLQSLRVDVANLANNHAFDSYLDGFTRTRNMLDTIEVAYFGAGEDLQEAARPLTLERNGVRLGWLGYADLDTRPSHVAGPAAFGVNPLNEEAALRDVSSLKARVHHVIVSIHWGVEFCHVPAPRHVTLARRLIDAGATLVIGHHAHVVQGIERYGTGAIAYNLGNLTTDDFTIDGRLAIYQTPRTRSSLILSACLTATGLQEVSAVPVRAADERIVVNDRVAARFVARANRQLTTAPSPMAWRLRRLYEDVILRTVWKLHPRVARSIQRRHLAKVFRNVSLAVRGQGPA